MRFVVGVDLSLSATGIAVLTQTGTGTVTAATEELATTVGKTGPLDKNGKPTECVRDRVMRSRGIARDIWRYVWRADLVVIEGLFAGARVDGKLIDRAATWMRVLDRCVSNDIPYAVIAPTALKKPITGTGQANKVQMISALVRLWPDLKLRTDNEIDALAMAHLGAVSLGWDVPTLERHREVTWTEYPDITSAGAVPIGGV